MRNEIVKAINKLCEELDSAYYINAGEMCIRDSLEALNEGHKFKLLTGNVWYPWVRFYRVDSVPEGSKTVSYTHLDVYKRQIEGSVTTAFFIGLVSALAHNQ